MRILFLILITLAVCAANDKSTTTIKTTTTTTTKSPTKTTITTKKALSTKFPGEARGKRNLYSLGNYAFQQQQLGNARQFDRRTSSGYLEPRAYFPSPQPYSIPYNGPPYNYVPDASNHLPENGYYQPNYQPQYLEAPEPIIEIIIKESNESLPAPQPQQFIQKKKKEQVQVFYVNYKKDQNNKLQLDSPVPALSPLPYHQHNDEEEEIIHHPIVTPLPPLKTTTLRTIIHPDSEKFHSNSGIHVSFNTEDKHQDGHQLQEHNEESVVQSVVALPQQPNYATHSQSPPPNSLSNLHGNEQNFQHQFRSEFDDDSQSRTISSSFGNQPIKGPFLGPPPHIQSYVSHQQQLPYPQSPSQPFRQFSHQHYITHQPQQPHPPQHTPPQHPVPQHPPPQHLPPQHPPPQHPQPQHSPPQHPPPQHPQPQHSPPQHPPSQHPPSQQQPSHHTQPHQPQPPPPNQHQQFIHQQRNPHNFAQQPPTAPPSNPTKQSIRFPPPGSNPNSFKQNFQYQVKHRQQQQQVSQHKPIPIPLQNTESEGQSQHQSFNRPPPFGPPAHAPPPQFQQPFPSETRFSKPQESNYRQKPPRPSRPSNRLPPQSQQPQQPQPVPEQQQYSHHQSSPQQLTQEHNHRPEPQIQHSQQQQQQHSQQQHSQQQHSQQQHHSQQHQQQHSQQQENSQQQKYSQQQHEQHQELSQQLEHSQNSLPPQPQPKPQFYSQNPTLAHGGLIQQIAPDLGSIPTGDGYSQQQLINSLIPDSELVKSVPRFEQHFTESVNDNPPFGQKYTNEQSSQINNKLAFNEFSSHSNHNNVIQNVPAPHLGPSTPAPNFYQHSPHAPQFGPTEFSNFNFSPTPTPQYHNFVSNLPQFVSTTAGPQYNIIPPSTAESQFYQQQNNDEHLQIVTPLPTGPSGDYIKYDHNVAQPQIIPNSQPRPQSHQNLPLPGQHVSTLHTAAFSELEQRRREYFAQQQQHQQQQQEQLKQLEQQYQQQQQQYQNQQHIQPTPHNYYTRNGNNEENIVEISGRNKYSVQKTVSVTQLPKNHRFGPLNPSSTPSPTTSSTTTSVPPSSTTTKSSQTPNIQLPDEVPDELRQQLLSSGILDNADISVLDYDKIGDVALENLPQEHLQHFYGAGGGSQISESHKVLTVVKPNGDKVDFSEKLIERSKGSPSLPNRQNVDLKVVRFDSTNQKSVTDKYIKQDSTVLPAVDIQDKHYNRYLPLKVSGAQFPIPDADELRGKKISSVVVLAPVDTLQNVDESNGDNRHERDIIDSKQVKFIAGDSLKQLLKKPNKDNFKRWLDKESKTHIDFQSVVLLVAKNPNNEQEIFMYDIGTKIINKLSGELSTAFVNVAEDNANFQDIENASISDSGIVEKMSTNSSRDPMEIDDGDDDDAVPAGSSIHETVVKFSPQLEQFNKNNQKLSINSGYSSINK